MKVHLIVDSTADVSEAIRPRLTVVPLTVHFGSEEYIDGVTISKQAFYEKLIESDVLPSTSQATPAAFAEVFADIAQRGESAVVLTISSKLSGTCQSAMIAAADYPGIYVVDSRSAATGTGILAELALRLMDGGMSAADVAARLVISEGAVEKNVTSIFQKLDLPDGGHRRVLAVLTWLGLPAGTDER